MGIVGTLRKRWRLWWFQWEWVKRANAGKHDETLRLLWCSELPRLRTLLASSSEPSALFRLACVELEAGDVDAAAHCLARVPDDPARPVLAGLIALRGANPYRSAGEGSWFGSLLRAWHDAGRPDLRSSAFLGDDFAKSHDRGARTHDMDPSERVLWMAMTGRYGLFRRSEPAAVRKWASTRIDVDVADLVLATSILSAGPDGPRDPDAHHVALERLRDRVSDNFWIELARFAKRPRERFDSNEVPELERIADAPAGDAAITTSVYERLVQVANKAGSRSPEVMAQMTAQTALILPSVSNLVRALQATPPDRQPTVARAFVRLGRRMHEDRYAVTFMFGNLLLRRAAEALDDQALFDELQPHLAAQAFLFDTKKSMRLDPLKWPLPSLYRETLARMRANELAYIREALKRESAAASDR